MRRVLIAQTGTYNGPRERLGDYDVWFRDLLAEAGADSSVWRAHEEPPPREDPAGVVITGSSSSVTVPEPWIAALAAYTRACAERGVPVLGVCFGHQLLATAFGGRVERHAAGREVGTVELELTEAGQRDPLFEGVPRQFRANATHGDHVALLPREAVVLACNEMVPVQAFALGASLRAVQFHPEYSGEALRSYAAANRAYLEREAGAGAGDRVATTACDTPEARAIVGNFVRHYLRVS